MQKINITKSILIVKFDQNDYISKNQKIYDDIKNILKSFDDDLLLNQTIDYIDNLNGDIFLANKKVDIFELKQNSKTISFAIFENKTLKTIWTDYDYLKLGFATILLRIIAVMQKANKTQSFNCVVDECNLVAQSLFDSFSKIDGVNAQKKSNNKKIEYLFDFANIDEKKILNDIFL